VRCPRACCPRSSTVRSACPPSSGSTWTSTSKRSMHPTRRPPRPAAARSRDRLPRSHAEPAPKKNSLSAWATEKELRLRLIGVSDQGRRHRRHGHGRTLLGGALLGYLPGGLLRRLLGGLLGGCLLGGGLPGGGLLRGLLGDLL